jgi:hypothetical protein
MQRTLRPYLTSGVVIVGAGTLIAAPIAVSPSALPSPVSIAVAPTAFADNLLSEFKTAMTNGGLSAEDALTDVGLVPGHIAEALGGSDLPDGVGVATDTVALIGHKFGELAGFLGEDVGDLPERVVTLAHAIAADPANAPNLIMDAVMATMSDLGADIVGPFLCIITENEILPESLRNQITQTGMTLTGELNDLEESLPPIPRLPLPSHTTTTQTLVEQKSLVESPPATFSNPVIPNVFHPPASDPVEEEGDAPVTTRPRLNVLKINPLANLGEHSTVGAPNSSSGLAPRPGVVAHVVESLTHPVQQLGSVVRHILNPHDNDTPSSDPDNPTE